MDLKQIISLHLEALFPSRITIDKKRYDELMPYFEDVNKASNHSGFTLLFHYNEYAEKDF
jgi:hypothetical protein